MNQNILLGLCIFLLALAPTYAWDDVNSPYRRNITIDNTQVDEDLNNIPIQLFIVQSTNINADGGNIRIWSDTGVQLPVEIEYYDATSGNLSIFFKGNLSSSSDTSFWLYYGNASYTLPAVNSEFGTENVWDSGFIGVWHFNIDPSSSNLIDSTSYNQDATMNGAMTSADLVNITYGKGIDFDGSNDYFSIADNSVLDIANNLTIDTFLTQDTDPESYPAIIRKGENYVLYKLKESLIPSAVSFRTFDGITANDVIDMPIGTKHFWNARYNNSKTALFSDGVEKATGTKTGALTTNAETFYIGYYPSAGQWDGVMDELRLSNISRSNGYISTTYNNLYNPTNNSGFYLSFGAEESQIGNPPSITINNPANTTYYTTNIPLNVTLSDSDSASFWCAIYNDGALVTNETTNTTYTTTLTKTGGSHNVSVNCEDAETATSTDAEYYYVFMGLNVSVFNNETNASMSDWDIFITNGTVNYTNTTLNNSALFEWDTLPTGSTNITISDGSNTLYFYNSTYERTLNNSALIQLNAYLLEKDPNPITLTSSLGWTVLEGQTTTINCSAPQGTPDFTVNSITVASPYIFTTSSGTYTMRCDVDVETTDYAPTNKSNTLIANPLISCSTNNTFAFSKTVTTTTNLTTLDFTTLVSQNLVRDNLGDVYVPGIISTWVDVAGTDKVIVNNTGNTSFVVYFGNLFVNNTYTTHAVSGDVDTMGAYTQINPYVQYNVLNELTGVEFFPPNATLTSIIHCDSGETYIPIDDNTTQFIVASSDYVDKASLRISYTADAYYSRQFYPSVADVTVLNFYVMDAFVHPLDRIDFIMLNMDHYTELLQIYKTIQSQAVIITEGYFDISHSFSAYLLEDVDYLIRTRDSNNAYTEFGRITIVAPAVKELGQITLDLNPQATLIAESILMNAYTNDARDTLSVVYSDATNQTEELNITVFFENGTIFQTVFYDDTNSVNINYNISAYSNQSFTVDFELNHTTFGNSPVSYSMGIFAPVVMNLGISALGYQLLSLISLVLIGGIVTRKSIVAGSVVLFMMVIVFKAINWLVIPTIGVVFIGVLMVLGIINYIKQGGE